MQTVTTLEELIPLLEGVTKAKEFGWIILQSVPAKPVSLKRRLALAARDHFGFGWTDNVISKWLGPSHHTKSSIDRDREATRKNQSTRHLKFPNYRSEWKERNPTYYADYYREKLGNDPAFKTRHLLRKRLWSAVKAGGTGKSASTMELTGCTLPELMAHLESQFTEGMTWANQGEWHIDHIRPCASFDLTDPEQQRLCFHWTNLQPLWGADNWAKGAKLVWSPNALFEPRVEPVASNS